MAKTSAAILLDTENLFFPFGWRTDKELDDAVANDQMSQKRADKFKKTMADRQPQMAKILKVSDAGEPLRLRSRASEVAGSLVEWLTTKTGRAIASEYRRSYGWPHNPVVANLRDPLSELSFRHVDVEDKRNAADDALVIDFKSLRFAEDLDTFVLGSRDHGVVDALKDVVVAGWNRRFFVVMPSDACTGTVLAKYPELNRPEQEIKLMSPGGKEPVRFFWKLNEIHWNCTAPRKTSASAKAKRAPGRTLPASEAAIGWTRLITYLASGQFYQPSANEPLASPQWLGQARAKLKTSEFAPLVDVIIDMLCLAYETIPHAAAQLDSLLTARLSKAERRKQWGLWSSAAGAAAVLGVLPIETESGVLAESFRTARSWLMTDDPPDRAE